MAAPQSESMEIFAGVGSWVVCSVGMLVFNKLAVTAFPLVCGLVCLQLGFTALVMLTCCWNSLHIGSRRDVARWMCVVPFFAGMILTSMFALHHASMTTVVTFRAISPLVALSIERFYPNPLHVTRNIVLCILCMIVGALIYAHSMAMSDYGAIWWLVLNNFFAIGDRLLQRLMLAKDQAPVDISKTAITLINNAAGLLPLLVAAYLSGEWAMVPAVLAGMSNGDWAMVGASCIVGVGISYTGIWAQSLISATSFLVLINANKFFIIFLEAYVMGTKRLTLVQVGGATLAILASVAYGKAREQAEVEKKTTASLVGSKNARKDFV